MRSALTAVIDLSVRPTWDVAGLLAPEPRQLWEQDHLVTLSGLAHLIAARSQAEDDEPVVTPGAVDPMTGDVGTRRGRAAHRSVIRVGGVGESARLGDVLVPQLGDAPCVLIGNQHRALSFVNFVALRTEQPHTALWLWATLSSTRGRRLRQTLMLSTTGRLPTTELLSASVPAPPGAADPRYARIAELHARTDVAASSQGRSWWRVTALPADGRWHLHLATPHPEVFDDGTPIGQLGTIVAGRNPDPSFEQPRPGALPVLNGRSVDGHNLTRWADRANGTQAEPGDLAIVEVGNRGRVAVVTEPSLVGAGVLLLKLHHPEQADALAAYLRSEPGQALRATLITGFIPRLNRTTLAQLPVPDEALTVATTATQLDLPHESLSEQLEQLL